MAARAFCEVIVDEIVSIALFERFCQRKWLQLFDLRQWMRMGDEQFTLREVKA